MEDFFRVLWPFSEKLDFTLGGLREIDVCDATKGGPLILFLLTFFACTATPSSGLGVSNRGCQLEDSESQSFPKRYQFLKFDMTTGRIK